MTFSIGLGFKPTDGPSSQYAAAGKRAKNQGREPAGPDQTEPPPSPDQGSRRIGRDFPYPEPVEPVRRLSDSDERLLVRRRKAGDPNAERELVTANLALVLRAAREYKQRGVPLDDLIQEGNLGLMRAARHFDPVNRAARFATYANYWIRCFIVRALASNSILLNHPGDAHFLRLQYRQAVAELRAQRATACTPEGDGDNTATPLSGQQTADGETSSEQTAGDETPTIEEVSEYLGVPVSRLEEARHAGPRQIDKRVSEDYLAAAEPGPDEVVFTHEDRAIVCAALRRLSPFEAWVICARFGLGHPPDRIIRWLSGPDDPASENDDTITTRDRVAIKRDREAAAIRGSGTSRSYSEMEKDCGLTVFRLHQVEKTALDKLRGLLGNHITDLT